MGVLVILLITGSLCTYYLYILPKQNEEKIAFEKQKYEDEKNNEYVNGIARQACLNEADRMLIKSVRIICRSDPLLNGGDETICDRGGIEEVTTFVNASNHTNIKNALAAKEEEKTACLKRYPAN
ncbi:MAG: hypothetical protein AAB588_06125 [Patescibacteria group bacterium]